MSFFNNKKLTVISLLILIFMVFISCQKEEEQRILTLNYDFADPEPKKGIETLIADFEAENPNIDIQATLFDREGYKTAIRNFLVSNPPDLFTWYPGNRMRQFVQPGLIADISSLWSSTLKSQLTDGTYSVSTMNGKQYAVPITYYQWGIYYRKDIFKEVGVEVPTTWDEFLAVCQALKDANYIPITIGTRFLWTAAGWFDHLVLASEGFEFYQDLTAGTIPYNDPRTKRVFQLWAELLDAGYFLKDHATYSWQEGNAFLLQGKAAMNLIGNFVVQTFGDDKSNYGFFPFPIINPSLPRYAEAPADAFFISEKSKNKEDAEKFLVFATRADNQEKLARAFNQLPVNKNAKPPTDEFNQAGAKLLQEAKGIAQFYDRDADPDMAKEGMKGFQEFMISPEKLDEILDKIEAARQKIYN